MSLYIALYSLADVHKYHWAIVAAPDRKLGGTVHLYHIRQNGGPWEKGQLTDILQDNERFVCCVELPGTLAVPLEVAEEVMDSQPIEQGSAVLTRYTEHWNCADWAIRTISELVTKKCLPDGFYTRLPQWKELLHNDVIRRGDDAVADKFVGTTVDGVRVLPLRN